MKKISEVEFKNRTYLSYNSHSQRLFSKGFGNFIKEEILELAWYEVLFLLEKKSIIVKHKNKELNFEELFKKNKIDVSIYLVYCDLKKKGFIVKEGLKFGANFRVYNKNEKHSKWLVNIYKASEKISANNIIGQNRIANTTNKINLYAIIDLEQNISYISSNWTKLTK